MFWRYYRSFSLDHVGNAKVYINSLTFFHIFTLQLRKRVGLVPCQQQPGTLPPRPSMQVWSPRIKSRSFSCKKLHQRSSTRYWLFYVLVMGKIYNAYHFKFQSLKSTPKFDFIRTIHFHEWVTGGKRTHRTPICKLFSWRQISSMVVP